MVAPRQTFNQFCQSSQVFGAAPWQCQNFKVQNLLSELVFIVRFIQKSVRVTPKTFDSIRCPKPAAITLYFHLSLRQLHLPIPTYFGQWVKIFTSIYFWGASWSGATTVVILLSRKIWLYRDVATSRLMKIAKFCKKQIAKEHKVFFCSPRMGRYICRREDSCPECLWTSKRYLESSLL